jgi:hypothetical protein
VRAEKAGRIAKQASKRIGHTVGPPPPPSLTRNQTHFLRIPKNIRSLLVSSGDFSGACAAPVTPAVSVSLDVSLGAVEAGESSKEPELVDAIVWYV